MVSSKKKDFFDAYFDDVFSDEDNELIGERGGVQLWLPKAYQQRWVEMPTGRKRKFIKKVREFVIQAIDRVEPAVK
ncbi:MAG: hypothetical protein JNL11_17455 [Bdellovibrionaceae bacterium]|nr:hypothetical protein [Pseudobdellovibrionaceae bacterium]